MIAGLLCTEPQNVITVLMSRVFLFYRSTLILQKELGSNIPANTTFNFILLCGLISLQDDNSLALCLKDLK